VGYSIGIMLDLWNKLFKIKTYGRLGIVACVIYGVGQIKQGKSYLEVIDVILIPLVICIVVYLFLYFRDKPNNNKSKISVDERLNLLPACEGDDYSQWNGCKGKVTYDNGDIYYGEFIDGKRWGKGSLTNPDGTVSKGEWQNDVLVEFEEK
jgi:hypothetical protein